MTALWARLRCWWGGCAIVYAPGSRIGVCTRCGRVVAL